MKPSVINTICAHPIAICWIIGAAILDTVLVAFVLAGVSLSDAANFRILVMIIVVLIPGTLLGYVVGMFTCWPLIRPLCSRFNGAPLKIGDRVLILSGSKKGTFANVYETTVGQGGWQLVRVDLGEETRKKFSDIFEEYSLLKIQS